MIMMSKNNDAEEQRINASILSITMLIKDKYPELSKYIEEMPVTIPTDSDPEITLKNLKSYLDSLVNILNGYKLEQELVKTEKSE
jgi:ferredoxin-fold anticodon binding domain-containing protein